MGAVIAVAALLAAVLMTAPSAPEETIAVLPGPDGRTGTVIVQRGDSRQVLDQPYAASRGGQPAVLTPQEVTQSFGAALQALPARPATFVLYFVTGTDELTDSSKGELPKVLAAMRERPQPDVIVTGHTDTVGDVGANDRLSAQRAERVKSSLVEIGIAAERIRTAGRGERELLIPTADNVEEPRNRRVEISVR
jgi:outer membrane protein OmpA-like peptidoglycan-associated protein